jgi:hypothetical protein
LSPLARDEGDHDLAPVAVGLADDGNFGHRFMTQ